ncbi:MAG: glucosamine--fructose-6-phosphate aminotransferase, partial [Ardenticatenia bacterium]|nr:glucosamine--fructose-6-phosphate aminotransferase [Ardenticatenia bacterium]
MVEQSHLFSEIHEQPQVLSRLLEREDEPIQKLASAIREHAISYVVIAARGTSDNAGRYAQYLLGAVNGLVVGLATPSLFTIYGRPPRFGNALVLGISQSGKSPDIVAAGGGAPRQGALPAAPTTVAGSHLAPDTH